jgi:thiol-disulfide isomerase/thioredoxin
MSSPYKTLLLVSTAILALVGGYWLAQSTRAPETTAENTPAYGGGEMIDFRLPDLDGKTRALEDWRGRVIVLNFWATWCPPCREEIPLFIALQKKHAADGLQVIGVAVDNKASVLAYRQSAGINYPILMGGDNAMEVAAKYGDRMNSLPYSVIISRGGSITTRKLGAFDEVELNGRILPLLTPPNTLPTRSN